MTNRTPHFHDYSWFNSYYALCKFMPFSKQLCKFHIVKYESLLSLNFKNPEQCMPHFISRKLCPVLYHPAPWNFSWNPMFHGSRTCHWILVFQGSIILISCIPKSRFWPSGSWYGSVNACWASHCLDYFIGAGSTWELSTIEYTGTDHTSVMCVCVCGMCEIGIAISMKCRDYHHLTVYS